MPRILNFTITATSYVENKITAYFCANNRLKFIFIAELQENKLSDIIEPPDIITLIPLSFPEFQFILSSVILDWIIISQNAPAK